MFSAKEIKTFEGNYKLGAASKKHFCSPNLFDRESKFAELQILVNIRLDKQTRFIFQDKNKFL